MESRRDHVAPASNSPLRVFPRRKRQPRPARHQLPDQRSHRFSSTDARAIPPAGRGQNLRLLLALRRLCWITRRALLRSRRNCAFHKKDNRKENKSHEYQRYWTCRLFMIFDSLS